MKTLTPWRAGDQFLDQMRNDMGTLFECFFGAPVEAKHNGEPTIWSPRLDISETDKAFVIAADLPGVEAKDVEVSVREGVLTLRGEKKEQKEEKHKNWHRLERSVGQFYRAVTLPVGVDEENVSAASAKGVLTVTIPKKPKAQPKKIAVKATES